MVLLFQALFNFFKKSFFLTKVDFQEDISDIFKVADKDNSGTLTVKEIQDVLGDICERYPQVELYLKSKQMKSLVDVMEGGETVEMNIDQFKKALEHVDFQVKNLPATAQVNLFSVHASLFPILTISFSCFLNFSKH